MTPEKVLEVIEIYRRRFEKSGVKKEDHSYHRLLESSARGFSHCHGMLDKMSGFVHEGRMDKTFRWLGFIQGFLWSRRICTLMDLTIHNRPSAEEDVLRKT